MLGSLEELGLIHREVEDGDRRQRIVRLTSKGRCSICRATTVLIGSGVVQLAVECALTHGFPYGCNRAFAAMIDAETMLESLRDGLGDVARLRYPWHPDY